MDRGVCVYCQQQIPPRNRKYCAAHSKVASALWKREHRRLWKAAGDNYWESNWKHRTPEERRTYAREYMRQYRRRLTASSAAALNTGGRDCHDGYGPAPPARGVERS